MKKYKMKPVRKIISKKTKYEDGIPEETLKLAVQIGILTREEHEVIKYIKANKDLNAKQAQIAEAIELLLRKQIIIQA